VLIVTQVLILVEFVYMCALFSGYGVYDRYMYTEQLF